MVAAKETTELKALLDWQEQRWGQEHPKVIATLEALADLLQMQKKYVEAEPLYWQILEKKHKLYGANDLRVADTIYDLACLHELQENWMECERLYKWTCDIRCKLLPAGDSALDESVNKVKEIASKQGHDVDENAFPGRDRSQSEGAAAVMPVTPFDWQTHLERARLMIMERNFSNAESILGCLTDVAESFQPGTEAQAECIHLLARVQFHRREMQDSLKNFEKTLALYEKLRGTSSKETATCLEEMGDLHCKLAERSEAEFLFNWALQILDAQEDLREHAARVRTKMENIEALCAEVEPEPEPELKPETEGESEEEPVSPLAVALADQEPDEAPAPTPAAQVVASSTTEEEYVPQNEDQVASYLWTQYVTTGKKALEKNDLAGAEIMLSRALDKAKNDFSFDDPRLWQTICDMASVYQKQGKLVRAEALFKSAQQLCEKSLGPQHPSNAKYWDYLGALYEGTGDNTHAAICYDKLVTVMVRGNRPLVDYAIYLKKLEKMHEKPPPSFFE